MSGYHAFDADISLGVTEVTNLALNYTKVEVILCTRIYRIPYVPIIYTDNFSLLFSKLGR